MNQRPKRTPLLTKFALIGSLMNTFGLQSYVFMTPHRTSQVSLVGPVVASLTARLRMRAKVNRRTLVFEMQLKDTGGSRLREVSLYIKSRNISSRSIGLEVWI